LRPGDLLDIGPLRFKVDYAPSDEGPALKAGRPEKASQTLEVLPVAEEEPASSGDDGELDALPVIDEDTHLLQADHEAEQADQDDEMDALPIADDLEADGDWQPSGDLRSILSEIDDKEGKSKRKGK
jgi:hypothetical protein